VNPVFLDSGLRRNDKKTKLVSGLLFMQAVFRLPFFCYLCTISSIKGSTYQERESKAEIIFENGKFVEIRISEVAGKRPLDRRRLAKFKQLVELYRDDIVHKWIDFFIYNKPVQSEMLTKVRKGTT
jgi:hypothetical protein